MKWLKDLIPSLKDRFSLAALFAILIYEIIRILVLERDPTIYSVILIVIVIVAFVVMLWLVDPTAKPKETELPRLTSCSVAFAGKLKADRETYNKIALLLGAKIGDISRTTDFVIGDQIGQNQEKTINKYDIRVISEDKWESWVEREVNRRFIIKRKYLSFKLNKIRNPDLPKAKKKGFFNTIAAPFRKLFRSWKNK